MPASGRLLQKLKETWGEDVTQDLVTWVNEAQTVNRAELRELADLYFARFGDRLDDRIALAEARWGAQLDERINGVRLEIARLESRLDAGVAGLEGRFNAGLADLEGRLNTSLAGFDSRLNTGLAAVNGRLDAGLAALEGRLDAGLAGLSGHLDTEVAGLRAEVASQMRDQMKWMFVFWIGTLVPLAGLIVALGKGWL